MEMYHSVDHFHHETREQHKISTEKSHQLMGKETDIRKMLRRVIEKGKEASSQVLVLLEDFVKAKAAVSDIVSSVEQNKNCFIYFLSRLKLAKHVIKATQEVDSPLWETSEFVNELVVDQSPPLLAGKTTVHKNLVGFLNLLRGPGIGVYAMGGSGKTKTEEYRQSASENQ